VQDAEAKAAEAMGPEGLPRCPTAVIMKKEKFLLPDGKYAIPVGIGVASVLIMPPRILPKGRDAAVPDWEPQVCEVKEGMATYTNTSGGPLQHDKNAHFRVVPMEEVEEAARRVELRPARPVRLTRDPAAMMKEIKVNREMLTPQLQARVDEIHEDNITVFDGDMSEGYNGGGDPYLATFSFRRENMVPPYRLWVPQFNRPCQDLLQAKCDELEDQGVLVDPKRHGIDIRHVSPCFIQQKGRAKHKPLGQCALSEVRFITCFNVLNDSIHPVQGRSNSYNDILKFLGRYKFFVFADLMSSYFQVKVHKRLWKYLGVMTPHRGLKVMTRLGQGMLNSDVELDQVLARVLGDEMTAGYCLAARDDLCVGGNSPEEAIANWSKVLGKICDSNLKLAPGKVRVLLQDTEVFGHRVVEGKIRPSDHIVTSLGRTSIKDLNTVKQVNSWKGLYKTLMRHLPHLANFMAPFDAACGGKASSSQFDWTMPGVVAAFNEATLHLKEVKETYLPHPEEQLVLQPDTSSSNLCSGWVLYTQRTEGKETVWLPVQYASAKLSKYMNVWTPCEQEAVGAVLAIDQVRHWINESRKTTIVTPDNKPVADAANLMKMGRHSKNGRLQSLLSSVNRSNVQFRHNSAKAGLHVVADALSRRAGPGCRSKDCQVERFLEELPDRVECMPVTLQSIALDSTDPAALAASLGDMSEAMKMGAGPIPMGSRKAWRGIQEDCDQCRRFLRFKRDGQLPGKKDKDKTTLNKMMKRCEVSGGLIVSREFDEYLMKETEKIYVPSAFLTSILTVMHIRLMHPLPTQLQKMFEKYFVAFGVQAACKELYEDCSLCRGLAKYPKELDEYTPTSAPEHPGSHMNTDVLRRAAQFIVVNCDRFSKFTTACIAASETREEMIKSILNVVTPIRHKAKVEVRTDRAPALVSLAKTPDGQLEDNGIVLVLGDHGNPNSNCDVDKIIRELEDELRKICPEGQKVNPGSLSKAVTILNDRVRHQGLSAGQIHFGRDVIRGKNLRLDDRKLMKEKRELSKYSNVGTAKGKAPKDRGGRSHTQSNVKTGQTVFLKSEGSKHTARSPLLVTGAEGNEVTVQRMLHTEPKSGSPPKIMAEKMVVEERFLYTPPHKRRAGGAGSSEDAWWRRPPRGPTGGDPGPTRKEPAWRPVDPPDLDEDDLVWVPTNPTDPPAPADQRPRLRLRLPMQDQGGGGGGEDGDQEPLDGEEDEDQEGGEEEEDEDRGPPDAHPLPEPEPDGNAEKARNREVGRLKDGLSTCFKPAGNYRTSRPPKRFRDQMDEPEQERDGDWGREKELPRLMTEDEETRSATPGGTPGVTPAPSPDPGPIPGGMRVFAGAQRRYARQKDKRFPDVEARERAAGRRASV
jgi:hypothetical protein